MEWDYMTQELEKSGSKYINTYHMEFLRKYSYLLRYMKIIV